MDSLLKFASMDRFILTTVDLTIQMFQFVKLGLASYSQVKIQMFQFEI